MIEKYEEIINEFQKLGYEYSYYPNSHNIPLVLKIDNETIKYIHVFYKYKSIILNGAFDKEELILILCY